MQVIKITKAKINEMLLNPFINFKFDSFLFLKTLVEGKHEAILMKWIIDLNSGINHLTMSAKKKHLGTSLRF
jgi:hypothetical protein